MPFLQMPRKRKPPVVTPVIDNTFKFTIREANTRTSAGIYKADGTLVRKLWDGVIYNAGTYTIAWDKKDITGLNVEAGSYKAKITTNKVVATWDGPGYNSSYRAGVARTEIHKGLDPINDMCFTGSFAYKARGYGEGSSPCGKMSISNMQATTQILTPTYAGPPHVERCCTDGVAVYWSAYDPYQDRIDASVDHTFVFASNVSDDKKKVFSSGVTPVLKFGNSALYSAISDMSVANSHIKGLAVQTTGSYLFVARPGINQIAVLNKSTGALIRNVTIDSPRDIKMNGDSKLLVITNNILTQYTVNSDGTLTSPVTFSGLVKPLRVAVNPVNGEIIVLDGGSSQQRKIFNQSRTLLRTLDVAGGYSTSATVSNTKNYWEDLRGEKQTFVAYQTDGTYWVGDGGNFASRKYSSDVVVDKITYLPRIYSSWKVHNAPNRLIVDFLEFSDPHTGNYKDTMELTHNWGYNITNTNYNQYVGLKSPVYINGRTYALVSSNGTDSSLQQVELVSGGNIRLTSKVVNKEAQFYENGDLWFMSYSGSTQQWKKYPITGTDGSNDLTHGSETTVNNTDTTVKNGGTFYNPGEVTTDGKYVAFEATKRVGPHLGGYSNTGKLLWATSYTTDSTVLGPFPEKGDYDIGNEVLTSGSGGPGSKAFVIGNHIFWHYYGEKWTGNGGQVNKFNGFDSNGLFLFQFGVAKHKNATGNPLDGMAGNAFAPFGNKVGDTYYIYHNDEGTWAGFHRWKLTNITSIETQEFDVVA